MKSPIQGLLKNILIVITIFVVLGVAFAYFNEPVQEPQTISITQLVKDINAEKIKEIKEIDSNLSITYLDGTLAQALKDSTDPLSQALINYGVDKEKIQKVSVIFESVSSDWDWLMPILLL